MKQIGRYFVRGWQRSKRWLGQKLADCGWPLSHRLAGQRCPGGGTPGHRRGIALRPNMPRDAALPQPPLIAKQFNR